MIKKHYNHNQQQEKHYRVNERIFAPTLRVLANDGSQLGVLSKLEALQKARAEEMDLVEIAPNAQPPVAKIINFNKFLYQLEKKRQEERRNMKSSGTKEVRLGPFMSDNDLDVMMKRARGFLEDSNKVRLVVKFTGPQMRAREVGQGVLRKALERLSDVSKIEKDPKFEGKQLVSIISPERKSKHGKEENQKISQ